MLKNRQSRRPVAYGLMALGALLMFLATEIWAGVVMFVLGVVIEFFGIKLDNEVKD